jgi:hypothetical protein
MLAICQQLVSQRLMTNVFTANQIEFEGGRES